MGPFVALSTDPIVSRDSDVLDGCWSNSVYCMNETESEMDSKMLVAWRVYDGLTT